MPDHVEVTGSGAATAVPDVVVLDTRVRAEAPDVATAVTLDVADPAPLLLRARGAAYEDAHSRADQHASLAGRPLGPVLRVTEGGGFEPPVPRFAGAAMDVGGGMPLEAGESTVTATVTVCFGLA